MYCDKEFKHYNKCEILNVINVIKNIMKKKNIWIIWKMDIKGKKDIKKREFFAKQIKGTWFWKANVMIGNVC